MLGSYNKCLQNLGYF